MKKESSKFGPLTSRILILEAAGKREQAISECQTIINILNRLPYTAIPVTVALAAKNWTAHRNASQWGANVFFIWEYIKKYNTHTLTASGLAATANQGIALGATSAAAVNYLYALYKNSNDQTSAFYNLFWPIVSIAAPKVINFAAGIVEAHICHYTQLRRALQSQDPEATILQELFKCNTPPTEQSIWKLIFKTYKDTYTIDKIFYTIMKYAPRNYMFSLILNMPTEERNEKIDHWGLLKELYIYISIQKHFIEADISSLLNKDLAAKIMNYEHGIYDAFNRCFKNALGVKLIHEEANPIHDYEKYYREAYDAEYKKQLDINSEFITKKSFLKVISKMGFEPKKFTAAEQQEFRKIYKNIFLPCCQITDAESLSRFNINIPRLLENTSVFSPSEAAKYPNKIDFEAIFRIDNKPKLRWTS